MKNPILIPTGSANWFDFAIATIDTRGAFLDHLFTDQDIPNQDEIRATAKADLDALRVKAAS